MSKKFQEIKDSAKKDQKERNNVIINENILVGKVKQSMVSFQNNLLKEVGKILENQKDSFNKQFGQTYYQ